MRIPSGVIDQYVYFFAVDGTDFTTPETGLTTFTVYRSRDGGASTVMTTPTINETDSVNMPGIYELLLDEDMTIGAGNDSEEMMFYITHAGMAPVARTIELYDAASAGVDVISISGSTAAADNLELSAGTIVSGAATVGTLSNTQMSTGLAEATANHYNGRVIIWTSGALANQATDITAYDGAGLLTFTAVTDVPADTDTFVIV